jgi:ribA/ribD-fused uncharacterized protein
MARSFDHTTPAPVDDPDQPALSFGRRRLHHGKVLEDAQTELGARRHIRAFLGPWRFLSNYWLAEMQFNGQLFMCAEAAYQAQKCADRAVAAQFTTLRGGDAKALGQRVQLVDGWHDKRIAVMRSVVTAKFDQHEHLRAKLIATGDAVLVEGNQWRDTFWGVCNGTGANWLGKILMDLRASYTTQR